MMENANSDFLNLRRLDIFFEFDEEQNIFYLRRVIAKDGLIHLPKNYSKVETQKEEKRPPSSDDFDEEQESGELPDFHLGEVNLSNLTFIAKQEYKLHKLQIKKLVLAKDKLDIKKFSLRTENTRMILKTANNKLHFVGWHRENPNEPKHKVKLAMGKLADGDMQAILKSTWFDAALHYSDANENFRMKYIRRLEKNKLKLPPISKFNFDFASNEGEFYIGDHRYQSKLNMDSGIVFENKDPSFPLYFDIDGLKLGLIGKPLTAGELGKLWFGPRRLTASELAYLSEYVLDQD